MIDTIHLLSAFTGIRTYTTQLCSGLELTADLNADYFFATNWRKTDALGLFKGRLNFVQKILNHSSYLLWKQVVLPVIAWYKKIDIIICPDYVSPRFIFRGKSFVVIHDTLYWEFKENYNPLWRKYFINLVQMGIRRDTLILATSNYTKERIIEVLAANIPTEVVYQSPKLLDLVNADFNLIKRYGLSEKEYFLHVGTFDKRKNLIVLVKAFRHFKNLNPGIPFKLCLVGDRGVSNKHDDYDSIVNLISDLNLNNEVVITGFVTNEALACLYASAFAYIFPSLEEGFGIPILEAMKFQVPVIISDRGSLQEVAGDAALVFNAESPEELAEKMSLLENRELREDFINKGSKRVENFSQEAFVRRIDLLVKKYF